MTDAAALLRAIDANPDEDTPRLMLADYLEFEAEPRDLDGACGQRLAVARRRVCASPEDDGPRLEYAEVLERYAGEVRCQRCNGQRTLLRCRGCGGLYRYIHKYSDCGRPECEGEKADDVPCPDCSGSGRVPDGRRDHAEFIRVQCELARVVPREALDDVIRGGLQAHLETVPRETWRDWPRVCRLLDRVRDIFTGRGAEWFGPHAVLAPPREILVGEAVRRNAHWRVVRRGFVDEVFGTLATLRAGPCGRCLGGTMPSFMPCSDCRGEGRTPGVLRGLVWREPVRLVRASDREPWENPDTGAYLWLREVSPSGTSHLPARDRLPAELFDRMQPDGDRVTVAFATAADAHAALSASLLAEARGGGQG